VSGDIVERLRNHLDSMCMNNIVCGDAADEIERLRKRLQACQSIDASPLTDDCITQNERFLLAENERLRAERDAERALADQLAQALRTARAFGLGTFPDEVLLIIGTALKTYGEARRER